MSDRWQAYDTELLGRSRRTRRGAEEPEAEPPPFQPVVAQGVRSRAAPLPRLTPDELLRRRGSGEVWRPLG